MSNASAAGHRKCLPLLGLIACLLAVPGGGGQVRAQAAKDTAAVKIGPSGLKVPRYVSLKADRVFLRQGPGTEYPTAWVFQRTGLPLEVIREFEVWRQVRDAAGTVGWVHGSLLSGRRTALVLPWELKEGQAKVPSATLREDDSAGAQPIAKVEAGVLVNIISCRNRWCRISVGDYRGYIEQTKLWGTYPDELIK
jgi:SH3-like domain-containing protein